MACGNRSRRSAATWREWIPESAQAAREAYECFEPYRGLEEYYASARHLVPDSCRDEVIALLRQVLERSREYPEDEDSQLHVRQNALVIANAGNYYTQFLAGGASSWNVRDRHMVESIENILKHHDGKHHSRSKMIVWAHNTHIGDARATDMVRYGMVNIGQLLREDFPGEVKIVGFDSYQGQVLAARTWDGLMENLELPEARPGSWEHLFRQGGPENRVIVLDDTFCVERRATRGRRGLPSRGGGGQLRSYHSLGAVRLPGLHQQIAGSAPAGSPVCVPEECPKPTRQGYDPPGLWEFLHTPATGPASGPR